MRAVLCLEGAATRLSQTLLKELEILACDDSRRELLKMLGAGRDESGPGFVFEESLPESAGEGGDIA